VPAALPLLFFSLSLLYFGGSNDWRLAILKAAVVWGVVVVAITESLSPFGLLSMPAVIAVWTLGSLAAGAGVWRRRKLLASRLRPDLRGGQWRMTALAVSPIAAIAAAVGVIALVAPPNTYDSMAYHMARVAHWAADGTITDYPTNLLRQLYLSPWSEFAVLQLQLLSGGDHLANVVQWFCMLGSIAGVSLIARQLGAPPIGQWLAAIVVATLPMGILQASSTQTDYVLAFWLVCSVALALDFVNTPTPQAAAWFASALGLAMLTKGTAYVFAAPLVVALSCWMVVRMRNRLAVSVALMVVIPLLINSGYFLRNQNLFHNPLGPAAENASVVNATFRPQAIASNVIRETVLQFGTPSTKFNQWAERQISRVHSQVLHIGLSDQATTFQDAVFHVNPMSLDEDYAGDPLQALLAIAAVLFIFGLALRRAGIGAASLIYAGGLVAAFLFFAAYLRWQPWNSRLELPLLVLSAPLIAVVVASRATMAVAGVMGAVLLIGAVPWVIDNQTRPLVGFALPTQPRLLPDGETIFNVPRTDLYFAKRQQLEATYAAIAAEANQMGCHEIGFWSGPADWEYALWVVANGSVGHSRVDSVLVSNESKDASKFTSKPCLVVSVNPDQAATVAIGGMPFDLSWSQGGVGTYLPSAAP